MKKWKIFLFIGFVLVLIFWTLILYNTSPQKIINFLGVSNSYLILFVLSIIGGTSIFLPFPYYLFTISFGAGGLNPFLLALLAGTGVMIGDLVSYYLGYNARTFFSNKFLNKITKWISKQPPFYYSLFILLYAAFIPLPDDIFMIPSGIIKYPLKRIIIPALIGKIIFNLILAIFGAYWLTIFFK